MKTYEIGNKMVVYDEIIYENKKELRDFMDNGGIDNLIETVKERCIIVLGGDGTMLRAIQTFYDKNLPFLGINFGTKGFLLNDKEFITTESSFKQHKYPLLNGTVKVLSNGEDKDEVFSHKAFNDIQVKTASGRAIELNVKIGDHSAVTISGDGVIISTPAGSTGYNSSAHGPILPHSSPNLIATAILPFIPKYFKPVVYEDKDIVKITNNNERKRPLSVYADGIPIVESMDKKLEIEIKKSKKTVSLLIEKKYEKTWNAKIYLEQGFDLVDNL